MKSISIIFFLLLLTSCQMGTETRIWKDCNPAMIEDYENIRTLQNNGFPKCEKDITLELVLIHEMENPL